MKIVPLSASRREKSGKGGSRQARIAGFVPAVVYGLGIEALNVQINERELTHLIHGALGEHAIVQLTVEGEAKLSGPAMLKEVQHDPVRGQVIHADLFRIDLSKKITTMVPTRLEGQAKGVVDGGIVEHTTREVEVACLPTAVPDFLAVTISDLGIGHSLHVSALVVPEGVDVLTNPDRVLVSCLAPRTVKEEVPAAAVLAEGAVPAEGAAAGAPVAAAPAAGEKKGGGEKAAKSEKPSKGDKK
jgi:large subunit ribosomal protein L25